jgi:hypothetical protein
MHSISLLIGETIPVELRISFPTFLEIRSVLVYAHVSVGVFTRTPFTLLGGFNSSVDRALCECLAGFPSFKGRTNGSLFFLFDPI